MLTDKRLAFVVLLMAAIAVVNFGLDVGLRTSFAAPHAKPIERHAADAAHSQPTNNDDSIFARIGHFVEVHNAAITAIATALLTIVTFLLAYLAFIQVRTSRSQLRAYISATPNKAALLIDDKTMVVVVPMKNTGQTPAFEFQQLGNALVLPYPIDGHIPFTPDPRDANRPTPTYVIYPGAEHANAPRLVFDWIDTVKMLRGDHALYVFGRMTYKDAFNRPQWGEFCAVLEYADFWDWSRRARMHPERQPVTAAFKFTKGNNRASI